MKIKIFAKSAIFNTDGKVLLLRRSATDPKRPGDQDFPGGNVEHGEDLAAGAARELHEEAGITLSSDKLQLVYAATIAYENEDVSVTRLLFIGHVDDSAVTLSFEHDAYQWVSVDEAQELFPHPFYGVGLKYAVDHGLIQNATNSS